MSNFVDNLFFKIFSMFSSDNGATPSTPSGILPIKFQKFESVDDKTKIYYMKTPSASHMIFMSNETMITLADGDVSKHFGSITQSLHRKKCFSDVTPQPNQGYRVLII